MKKEYFMYYMAGFIDGEGTITLTPKKSTTGNKTYRCPVVSASSTTLEILKIIQHYYGGHISTHKVYQDHHKPSYSWKVIYNKAVTVCEDIEPYLLEPTKKYRAYQIAHVYPSITPRNGKYTTQQAEKKLKFQEAFFHPSKS